MDQLFILRVAHARQSDTVQCTVLHPPVPARFSVSVWTFGNQLEPCALYVVSEETGLARQVLLDGELKIDKDYSHAC